MKVTREPHGPSAQAANCESFIMSPCNMDVEYEDHADGSVSDNESEPDGPYKGWTQNGSEGERYHLARTHHVHHTVTVTETERNVNIGNSNIVTGEPTKRQATMPSSPTWSHFTGV